MKLILPVFCLFLASIQAQKYDTRFFIQPVDHFNRQNTDTFKQKVLVNFDFWKDSNSPIQTRPQDQKIRFQPEIKNSPQPTGPIFFYTGNEGPVEAFSENSGFIYELAEKFNAGIVFAEHRYYGISLPYGEESFSKDKIGWLSIEQALADFSQVIEGYLPSQVICFGGSYGGMLSAYMRYKYPHLVTGAIAASAPIKWIHFPKITSQVSPVASNLSQEKLSFQSQTAEKFKISGNFFNAVTNDYTQVNPECSAKIKAGFDYLKVLIDTQQYETISQITNQCHWDIESSANNHEKALHVAEWLRNMFVMMAMMNYPYSADFMGKFPAWPVKATCQKILAAENENLTPMEAVMAGITTFYGGQPQKCYDAFTDYIHCADPTGCGTGPAAIAWDYQACSEMLLPNQNPNFHDMFLKSEWNDTIRETYCQNKYGITPNYDKLKIEFSLLEAGSRIIFSNGGQDPWGPGGITSADFFVDNGSSDRQIYSFFIPSGAHHLDLRGSNQQDPADVMAVREKYVEILKLWLD